LGSRLDDVQKQIEARKKRIEQRIEQSKRVGHEQTLMEKAIVAAFAGVDPNYEPAYRDKLKEIERAIQTTGSWQEYEEWRISTSFDSRIVKTQHHDREWYAVSVECDRQKLCCECPTIKKALAFLALYQRIIVDQFYTVGPPWADNHVFEQ
jgi:hypothetical protein